MSRRKQNREKNENKNRKVKEQKYGEAKKEAKKESKVIITPTKAKKFVKIPPCHIGFTEILPHLFVGKEGDLTKEFVSKIDILVPLNDLRGNIWDMEYRNEIMYLPVRDYDVLPQDVELHYVKKIASEIRNGKNVAIFCLGGHGRTGYVASLVLHELDVIDPIGLLRSNYCDKAVESTSQVEAIASYCNDLTLIDKYGKSVWSWLDYADIVDYGSWGGAYGSNYNYGKVITYKELDEEDEEQSRYNELIGKETCGDCAENWKDTCCLTGCSVFDCKGACDDFVRMA